VKEEVIARLLEVGVSVVEGRITFNPFILRKSEFLLQEDSLGYFDINGGQQSVALAAGQLGFTYCQVPVVYSLAEETSIVVHYADGTSNSIDGNNIDADTSMQIFDKKGVVSQIEVALKPGLE